MQKEVKGVICLCGNDGTGKSTLLKLIIQKYPSYLVLERSAKQFLPALNNLHQQIKHLDQLTYTYAFEQQRSEFDPSSTIELGSNRVVPVHWIMLHVSPDVIFKRISQRLEMSIYESKKCVQYFSFIYLELAAFYGMSIVDMDGSPQQISQHIMRLILTGATREIRSLQVKTASIKHIQELDIANQIIQHIDNKTVEQVVKCVQDEIKYDPAANQFFNPELNDLLSKDSVNKTVGMQIAIRWITSHFQPSLDQGQFVIIFQAGKKQKRIPLQSPSLSNFTEGESKIIYQVRSKIKEVTEYFSNRVWIILKSTIYSHTNQHTGYIQNLGSIRATGSNLFLQMLRRNNLHHAYIAINSQGVIFSRKVAINMLEVIFKKECIGTDRHSYIGISKENSLVGNEWRLMNGIYIRFDWRNPNHIVKQYPSYLINLNPYYYVVEKAVGKQTFFDIFLRKQVLTPIGDKCITEDLINNYVDTKAIKKAALSLYCSFSYYCRRVNLELIDGCFMFTSDGSMVWSQINPDCMRVKRIETGQRREDFDKDIWRAGGSSSKDHIRQKWTLFNKLLSTYFQKNRFHETELLQLPPFAYTMSEQALRLMQDKNITLSKEYLSYFGKISQKTRPLRQVIATIDISQGKPTLVKSSALTQIHSGGNLEAAFEYLRVIPKIVLVDLDSAIGKEGNNRDSIKNLRRKGNNNIFGVGGGIRSLEALHYYLNQLAIPRVILSSNLDLLDHLSLQIIEKRIIVELSINEKNQILTHGRTLNTGQDITNKMIQLSKKGVKIISITFNHCEGHLKGIPKHQFRDIMFTVPGPIQKVIIAGGISSLQDLQLIWGYPKTVPQLGSAIWKNKIPIQNLVSSLVQFKDCSLCPAVITSESGKLLGEVFVNRQALILTIQTRQLFRYSRKLKRVIKKGQQSGNIQKIIAIRIDCDNDCLNFIVEENKKPFCHLYTKSCFDSDSSHFQQLGALQEHISRQKSEGSGYSKKMQENQHFSAFKVLQECHELVTTQTRVVEEGADTFAHILMFLNSKNIPLSSIIAELDCRAKRIKQLDVRVSQEITKMKQPDLNYFGVVESKHGYKLDVSALELLGVEIVRGKHRNLKISLEIKDKQKYSTYFKNQILEPIMMKSKDMSLMLFKKQIRWCFNYSIMMQNYPTIWKQVARSLIPQIKLCAIKKKSKKVEPLTWNKHNKGKIASQYPISMISYLQGLGVDESVYSLLKVTGSSEAFLQNDSFDYCDAIVQTGSTIEDNNLEIVAVLCPNIYGALYTIN